MRTIDFASSLSQEMTHFVKLKQSCGSDYRHSAKLLLRFDRHLTSLSFKGKILSRSIFQDYFETLHHLCGRGFGNHYCVLQHFSAWLSQHEAGSHILERRRALDRSYSRAAYIFTLDEVRAILEISGRFSERQALIPGIYQTLFGLLYSTGIRIGEALALNHADYIEKEKLIHIREGKFRKERYLVLSSSTAHRLDEYIRRRKTALPFTEQTALFVNICRRPLTYNNAFVAFTRTLHHSGIIRNNGGPRLHDFRHTFAVHRLLQWYRTEEDVNARLPFLSTYMGHVDITSTQVYLAAAGELLRAGNERFHTFFMDHIK